MRVLIVNTLYPPIRVGGAEKSVALLAEALARAGDQVSVLTLHPGPVTEVEDRNGVRVYRVPLANLYWPFGRAEKPSPLARLAWHLRDSWNWQMAKRVGFILDLERPDVVHTNNLAGFSVAVFREVKKRNIRLVHTLRDYYMVCERSTLFRSGGLCERQCIGCKAFTSNRRPLSEVADAVVSNSGFVLHTHQRLGWFRGVPASVVFNIADGGRPHPARVPARHRADDQNLTFGYIGKIVDEKGIEVVLAATTRLTRPNWRLRIAGVGLDRYVASLRRQYPDPRIEWLGFADAAAFYPAIDVSLIASVWAEPLPRTLIESFAAGKSAICAESGGILEIASLGKLVATYPAKDAGALAGRMDAALNNVALWRGGGWLNPAAMEGFSEAAVTASYRSVYRGDGGTERLNGQSAWSAWTRRSNFTQAPATAVPANIQPRVSSAE